MSDGKRVARGAHDGRDSSPASRRLHAVESFQAAAECIGPIVPGLSRFAITRGQFSMIDAVLAVLDGAQSAAVSLWTWTVAEYEVQCLTRLRLDQRISSGLLVIDSGARRKNAELIKEWKSSFGPESVRYVVNHAKIATIERGGMRFLLRGSMNLNFNPRFEQFDITEGGEDFDLVRSIEAELPLLGDQSSQKEVYAGSKVSPAFDVAALPMFSGAKPWSK